MTRPYGQRGVVEIKPLRRDAEGKPLCRWCDAPVPKARKSWCSSKCVEEWRERGDWNHIRNQIIQRDKVCQMCGGRRLDRHYNVHAQPHRGIHAHTAVAPGRWEVDHIVPVEQGGTDDPLNLRLLCSRCHKDRTAKQRRDKAAARRAQLSLIETLSQKESNEWK